MPLFAVGNHHDERGAMLAIEFSPVGMLITDRSGTVTVANRIARSMFDCWGEPIIGMTLASRIKFPSGMTHSGGGGYWALVSSSSASVQGVIHCSVLDGKGTRRPLPMMIAPLDDVSAVIVLLPDGGAEDTGVQEGLPDFIALAEQNQALKLAITRQQRRLSELAHELLAPLNAIIGFSALLDQGRVDPNTSQHAEFVRHILDGGRQLLSVINSSMEAAKRGHEDQHTDTDR